MSTSGRPPRLLRWLRFAASMPAAQAVTLTRARIVHAIDVRRKRANDAARSTYLPLSIAPDHLIQRVRIPETAALERHHSTLERLAENAVQHRFNLLGSDPVLVRHGASCVGLEGIRFPPEAEVVTDPNGSWLSDRIPAASVEDARLIWRLVDPGYVPIDWQLDFRSGYRWSERVWSEDIPIGDIRGADIKVPWELARMQHLPQLALAQATDRSDVNPDRYAREFRNQVLDFIATNPPRFGVNWKSTMDVAIRVVNWLVAWSLFAECGSMFEAEFDQLFRRSVLEHGRHIAENLEWHPTMRANHYLADIVGLLYVAAFLPPSDESDSWLQFASSELMVEADRQLQPDGTGFEASTCYHRLSAEMITYGIALVAGLTDEDRLRARSARPLHLVSQSGLHATNATDGVPDKLLDRLSLAAQFTIVMTKPTGSVVQIGDNDNGRFLKLIPSVVQRPTSAINEDHLDHRHLVAAIGGLVGRHDFLDWAEPWAFEAALVRRIAGFPNQSRAISPGRGTSNPAADLQIGNDSDCEASALQLDGLPPGHRVKLRIDLGGTGALVGVRRFAYPDFGVYVLRSDRVFLAIRCGPVGQSGNSAHAHNDQLGIELMVDGADWVRDPGSYVYTPLPERRNAYRSVHAHFAPGPAGGEPASLDLDLFVLGRGSQAQCLYWGEKGFAGVLKLDRRVSIQSHVELSDQAVLLDYGFVGCLPDPRIANAHDWRDLCPVVPFSPGYGSIELQQI